MMLAARNRDHESGQPLPWRLLTVEAGLIVLSVILALALESWRQRVHEYELAVRALMEAVHEVEANCEAILAVAKYHRAVVRGERSPQGVQVGLLRNDAWDVAKATGAAVHLDYSIASRLVEIAALQQDHRSMILAYLQALFAIALPAESEAAWHMKNERGVINELVRIQNQLTARYRVLADLTRRHYAGVIDTRGICTR